VKLSELIEQIDLLGGIMGNKAVSEIPVAVPGEINENKP
jgi:hypothetical protein